LCFLGVVCVVFFFISPSSYSLPSPYFFRTLPWKRRHSTPRYQIKLPVLGGFPPPVVPVKKKKKNKTKKQKQTTNKHKQHNRCVSNQKTKTKYNTQQTTPPQNFPPPPLPKNPRGPPPPPFGGWWVGKKKKKTINTKKSFFVLKNFVCCFPEVRYLQTANGSTTNRRWSDLADLQGLRAGTEAYYSNIRNDPGTRLSVRRP